MKTTLKSITKSTKPTKKLQATFLIDGKREKTVHFGSAPNKDYTIYYATEGKEKADKMKAAYLARHSKTGENWKNPLSAGALSRWVLWSEPTVSAGIKQYKRVFGF